MINEEDEVRLYHVICDISRVCKKYFYERKYLPRDAWSMEKVVKSIYQSSKLLNNNYNELKILKKGVE